MINMSQYSRSVRRSLLPRDMLGGIPTAGLLLLLILAVVFMYVFGWIWFIVPIVLLYFVMRFLTARDEWMIDMVIENIGQKDIYIP
ncbi:MAG: hypothetical protein Pg6A_01450 [Termitinemataceae bacterium]|jgi:type IV secretory pathway VirB3-like protein|nr:MAG: hypothetical protein Pg6A_01450 [Termitinemataceae bacterium]